MCDCAFPEIALVSTFGFGAMSPFEALRAALLQLRQRRYVSHSNAAGRVPCTYRWIRFTQRVGTPHLRRLGRQQFDVDSKTFRTRTRVHRKSVRIMSGTRAVAPGPSAKSTSSSAPGAHQPRLCVRRDRGHWHMCGQVPTARYAVHRHDAQKLPLLVCPRVPRGADAVCRNCESQVMAGDPGCWNCSASFRQREWRPEAIGGRERWWMKFWR